MLRPNRFLPLLAVVLLLSTVSLVGCSKRASTGGQGATSDTTGMGGAPGGAMSESTATGGATGQLSEAQIAAIVKTANAGDVANAKAAEGKTKNNDVKTFARQMVNDHTAANKNVDALAKKLNIKPEDNPTSNTMKQQVDAKRDSLKKLSGAEFDRAYMEAEVALHQQVLNDLDNTLIPAAQNPDMKRLLQETRSVVANHLKMAQDVVSKLGGGGGGQ